MKRNLILLLAIVPALCLGLLVYQYGVNLPFWDQWDTPGKLIVEASQQSLTGEQWMRQHNESRTLFPNLVFLSLAHLTHWNTRWEMLLTFALSCLVSLNIYCLGRITFKNSYQSLFCYLLANLLIFNPIQNENWLWGFQGITFTSIAGITTALVVIFLATPWKFKLLVSAMAAIIATFSFANGVLCWIVIFPALIIKANRDRQNKIKISFFWLLISSATLGIYLHNYHRPADLPSVTQIFLHPILAINYYTAVLGSAFYSHDLSQSQLAGIIILLIFAGVVIYLWQQRTQTQLIDLACPWLLIGLYVLLSIALITTGRMSLGIDTALAQRYITFSTYLIVALIYLFALILSFCRQKTLTRILVGWFLIWLLITYQYNLVNGVKWMTRSHYQRVYGKACLLALDLIRDESCITKTVYPVMATLETQARKINEIGFLQPGILSEINWQESLIEPKDRYGAIASLSITEDGNYLVAGWTVALANQPSVDAVILASQTESQTPQALAIVELGINNDQLGKLLIFPHQTQLNWSKILTPEELPPLNSKLTAWAFDTDNGKAYPLASNLIANQ